MDNQQQHASDEISLKELILLVQAYIREVLRFWWLVVVFGVLFGVLMVVLEYNKPIEYTSNLTFTLDDDKGAGAMGMVSGLLGSFGLGGSGGSNVDKMIRLMKSRQNIRRALFRKGVINGKDDFFANHLIDAQELEIYEDEEGTKPFRFAKADFNRFDTLSNAALVTLHGTLVGSEDAAGILEINYDELSGFIGMNLTSLSEDFAVEFLLVLFEEVDKYYVETAIEKNNATYAIIEKKVDSLQQAMAGTEYQLAQAIDKSRGQYLNTHRLTQARLKKDLELLIPQYGEAIKNKELAEFSLLSVTPVVQAVDTPIYPIEPADPSLPKALVIGGFIGGFLSVMFIVARKVFKDAMRED